MPRPYSNDLRERAAASVAVGRTCRETAALSGVSVVKWSQRQRASGTASARRMGRHSGRELAPHRDWLLERVAAQPSVSVWGLAAELAEHGVRAAPVSVWRVLKEAAFSFEKNAVRQRAGQAVDRPATGPVAKVSTQA